MINKKGNVESTLMVVIKIIITTLALLFILFPIVMMIIRISFRNTSDDYAIEIAKYIKNALENPSIMDLKNVEIKIPFSKIGPYTIVLQPNEKMKNAIMSVKKEGIEFKKLTVKIDNLKSPVIIYLFECNEWKCFLELEKEIEDKKTTINAKIN